MIRRLIALLLAFGCAAPVTAQTATINFSNTQQRMDGFGASTMFLDATTPLTEAQADLYFDATKGVGLSLLRLGMRSDGTLDGQWADVTKAATRGVRLWMAPWTAAAAQKDNGSETSGGHLLTASRDAWATTMAAFATTTKTQTGANLYAVSVQNEPDFTASYVSMLYTNAEMTAFVKVLGPKLAGLSPAPVVMLPEVSNWPTNAQGYLTDTLGDGTAAPYVGVLAGHQYSGLSNLTSTHGLQIWQTEYGYFDAFDASITKGLTLAADIQTALTTYSMSAWHYWWLISQNADNEGLVGNGGGAGTDITETKRLYVMGQWSKFVRPNWFRAGVTLASVPAGVTVSAFKSNHNAGVAVVVINTSGSSQTITYTLQGLTPGTVTPYVTSSTQDLAALAPVTVTAGSFSATVANSTVTTFVGTLTPPTRRRNRR